MEPPAFSGFPLGWAAAMDLENVLAEEEGALWLPAPCLDLLEGRIGLRLAAGGGIYIKHRGAFPHHLAHVPRETGDLPICRESGQSACKQGVTQLIPSFSSAFFQVSSTFKYTHRYGHGHIVLFSQFSKWCSVLQSQLSLSLPLGNFLLPCGVWDWGWKACH